MNRKQLTLILVAFVVLGGLGLWLRTRDAAAYKTSSGQMGQKVLGEFDANAVARIVIRQGTNALNLFAKDDRWLVAEREDYPANFSEISDALRKLWDLKVTQPLAGPLGASALERLEINPASTSKPATVVELQDKDGKVLRALVLGKQHRREPASPSPFGGEEGFADGRYVMLKDQPASVSLVSETFNNLEPKADAWLSKDFFKVEKLKAAAVTFPEATNSWKLSRASETNEWVLADAGPEEKLDSGKAGGVANALSWPSFTDVIAKPNLAELGLDQPIVAQLETFDGFSYTLKAGRKAGNDEHYYLTLSAAGDIATERKPGENEKPEDKEKLDKEFKEQADKLKDKLKAEKALEGRVFQVSKWTLDALLKKRHELLAEKKVEAAPAAAGNPVDATFPPPVPDMHEEGDE